ncbi:hypothetical protein [Paenibacillus crassostreae]|uniref:Uncharacterized protein n=1 Tax=Paenibacillus crassostreae TaxID=1763538 RepID=A0A167FF70_9BACL|nr:hypothetical protein [Paenibacillus crassostreae]AOZ94468.1 hypothetical protein LPB68_21210 [Paenibacillus crassostreae]OAB76494.1 hypothetical protein PNBC_03530 [Paenibacillus crassostreae]
MTEENALHAIIAITGVPAELLVLDAQSDDVCYVYVSTFSKKTYYVESSVKVNRYTLEEMNNLKVIGEHDGLSVYEMIPWWQGL